MLAVLLLLRYTFQLNRNIGCIEICLCKGVFTLVESLNRNIGCIEIVF